MSLPGSTWGASTPSVPSSTGSSQRECTSMALEDAPANHPLFRSSSGSHAPKKTHSPSHHASTQAWLSSQWDQRGTYTCLAGIPRLRSTDTVKVDSSPQRP